MLTSNVSNVSSAVANGTSLPDDDTFIFPETFLNHLNPGLISYIKYHNKFEFIRKYASNLVGAGYFKEYALEVAKSMAILYENGIDVEFQKISVNAEEPEAVVADSESREARHHEAKKKLATVMAEYGGNLTIVQRWLAFHQTKGSQCYESCAYRYFLENQLRSDLDYSIYKRCMRTGADGQSAYEKVVPDEESKLTYFISMVFYRAFTAIGLAEVQYNPLSDETFHLYRGIMKAPDDKLMHGILDPMAYEGPPTGRGKFGYIYEFTSVPINRVHAAYFLSPALCQEWDEEDEANGVIPPAPKEVPVKTLKEEREFIVHLAGMAYTNCTPRKRKRRAR